MILILLVIVSAIAAHELGHMIAAKSFGCEVREYAIGMGPKLLGWQGKHTRYNLRLLPVGGYVDINVEELEALPFWKYAIVLLGGVTVNFVLALLFFTNLAHLLDATPLLGGFKLFSATFSQTLEVMFNFNINTVSSVVGITDVASQMLSSDMTLNDAPVDPGTAWKIVVLFLAANINIGLGILNLIPIPILDGGQIIFNGLNRIFKFSDNVELWVKGLSGGMVMALSVYIVVKDVMAIVVR